jgi:hypothetical protein
MFEKMIGVKVEKIFMNEEFLKFQTDKGNFVFTVDGDCCSESVFYDFYGVKDLIGRTIKEVNEVELKTDERMDGKNYQEAVSVYGYEVVYEDKKWGDRTAVFSFRNYSNGYYGGAINETGDTEVSPEITDDVIMTQ